MLSSIRGWMMGLGRAKTPITMNIAMLSRRDHGVVTRWAKYCAKSAEMVERAFFEDVVETLTINEGNLLRKLAYQGSLLGEDDVCAVRAAELLCVHLFEFQSIAKKLHEEIDDHITKLFVEEINLFSRNLQEAVCCRNDN